MDWLHAGVNIITTVTYQCHYGLVVSSENPPSPQPRPASAAAGDKTTICSDDDNNVGYSVGMSTDEMLRQGVSLARRAVKESNPATMHSSNNIVFPTFVVASTGPYGAAMADGSEYTGQYPVEVTRDKLKEFHRRKASTILSNHPDGIAIETIPNLEEVGVVCEVMKELLQQQQYQQRQGDDSLSPRTCCCWISFACKNDHELNDGHTVQEALDLIQLYDPDCEWISAIGVNCCDSAYVPNLVKLLTLNALSVATREKITAMDERDSSSTVAVPEQQQQQPKQKTYQHLPTRGIVVYPNSGESWDAANNDWKDETGATDLEFSDRLMESVALVYGLWNGKITTKMKTKRPYLPQPPRIVLGGCCRTNPATIALLRQRIDDWEKKKLCTT
mmetsp:Transcript_31645/g.76791  ORF Transcript_31645/g.76791 Transcript_31645/m.76791 type:complete len:389 (-) Transcript_31645:61-1227(-)